MLTTTYLFIKILFKVENLCEELDSMYVEGCEVLYDWYIFLKDSLLEHLQISNMLILQPWNTAPESQTIKLEKIKLYGFYGI